MGKNLKIITTEKDLKREKGQKSDSREFTAKFAGIIVTIIFI